MNKTITIEEGNKLIERLTAIHYQVIRLVEKNDWKGLRKRFDKAWRTGDVNIMKMVLTPTIHLVNNPEVLEERYKVYQRFNDELGWTHKKWPMFMINDSNVPNKYKPNQNKTS